MKRTLIILQFLLAATATIYAQHLEFVKNSGEHQHVSIASWWDSILSFDIDERGELTWVYNGQPFKDVESVLFRNKAYDDIKEREALIELYKATDGDHWADNTNWCSDKPLSEWYGVGCDYATGRVTSIMLSTNKLKGTLPESLENLSWLEYLSISNNPNLTGNIPQALGKLMNLWFIGLDHNGLTGPVPGNLFMLPRLKQIDLNENQLSGTIPETLTFMMDKAKEPNDMWICHNRFTGKVPDAILHHKNFRNLWPAILIQDGEIGDFDIKDIEIPGPDFELTDMNGVVHKSSEIYARNKLTLLYEWASWCPYSKELNIKLIPAYSQYKDKGFEVLGLTQLCGMATPCSTEEEWMDYLQTNHVEWPNVVEDFDNLLNVIHYLSEVPLLLLVDQNGKIIFSNILKEDPNIYALVPKLEEYFGALEGGEYYTSTDYSRDGEVYTMQTATEGRGINLVFMGDGFVDTDMGDGGKYEKTMQKAMEQFFAVEPLKSLRSRFNVYGVKAVSPNAEFSQYAVRAIDRDDSKAFRYASKISGLRTDEGLHVNVIYNTDGYGIDRSYCSSYFGDGSYVCYAMDGGASMLLNHESGGHGIGRLSDEYVEPGYEGLSLPESEKQRMISYWADYGYGANVDWRSTPTEVKWSKFVADPRYAEEGLGAYEGSFLYGSGAYRPTENSMMRYNDTPFNAPSREAIYKFVMRESEGSQWVYDYETFVQFDAAGREEFVNAKKSGARGNKRMSPLRLEQTTKAPILHEGTWRDTQ